MRPHNAPLLNASHFAAYHQFGQPLVGFESAASVTLAPLTQPFVQTLREWHQFLQDAYDRAGQPYGGSEEGLCRWCEEQARQEQEGPLLRLSVEEKV